MDPAARESIPNTVRWFQTLVHHQSFASVLGPVTLATAALEPAKAASKGAGAKTSAKKPKEKAPKEGKPKQTPKALANGPAAGVPRKRFCHSGPENSAHFLLTQRPHFLQSLCRILRFCIL